MSQKRAKTARPDLFCVVRVEISYHLWLSLSVFLIECSMRSLFRRLGEVLDDLGET